MMRFLRSACLICLICIAQQAQHCRRPHPKSVLKFDLKCRPPKKCRIRPKVGPNGGPESAQFGLKSALDAFLGLLDLKNEPPEGPLEKASNFERFWAPLGGPQLGSPLSLAQISAFRQGPEKSSFWHPFWLLFGPQIGYDAHFGGPWADFGPKIQGLKNSLFSDAHILAIMVENGPPNRSSLA